MNNKYVNRVNLFKSIAPNMINIKIDDAHFIVDYKAVNNHVYFIKLYYSKIPITRFALIKEFHKEHNRKLFENYITRMNRRPNGVYIPIDLFKELVSKYDKDILDCMKKYVSIL